MKKLEKMNSKKIEKMNESTMEKIVGGEETGGGTHVCFDTHPYPFYSDYVCNYDANGKVYGSIHS